MCIFLMVVSVYTVRPGFDSHPINHSEHLSTGERGEVVCPGFPGHPAKEATWSVNGTEIEPVGRYSTEENGLRLGIDRVRFSDAGVYTCSFPHNLTSPPIHVSVVPRRRRFNSTLGDSVDLSCSSLESTECVSWEVNNEHGSFIVDESMDRYRPSEDRCTLTIDSTTEEDYFSRYVLHIGGGSGNVSCEITLLFSERLTLCVEDEENTKIISDVLKVYIVTHCTSLTSILPLASIKLHNYSHIGIIVT